MKPIMLATDGSPSAEAATREAIDLAQHLGVPLLAVSVEHNSVPAYGYYGYGEIVTELRKVEHDTGRETARGSAASSGRSRRGLRGTPPRGTPREGHLRGGGRPRRAARSSSARTDGIASGA